jgi:hypothetical protein
MISELFLFPLVKNSHRTRFVIKLRFEYNLYKYVDNGYLVKYFMHNKIVFPKFIDFVIKIIDFSYSKKLRVQLCCLFIFHSYVIIL